MIYMYIYGCALHVPGPQLVWWSAETTCRLVLKEICSTPYLMVKVPWYVPQIQSKSMSKTQTLHTLTIIIYHYHHTSNMTSFITIYHHLSSYVTIYHHLSSSFKRLGSSGAEHMCKIEPKSSRIALTHF